MADHRQQTTLRRWAAQLSPKDVPGQILICIGFQFLVFAVLFPASFLLTGDPVLAVVLAVIGVFGSGVELWLTVARTRTANRLAAYHDEVDRYREDVERLAALTPGGAPIRAYWRAHCGCVHVEVWHEDDHWTRETMAELNPQCPLVDAYSPVGGQGV